MMICHTCVFETVALFVRANIYLYRYFPCETTILVIRGDCPKYIAHATRPMSPCPPLEHVANSIIETRRQ